MTLLDTLLGARLPRTFFDRPALVVAPALLGTLMVSYTYCTTERTLTEEPVLAVGRVVETEAYDCPNDPACWAYRRQTARNRVMWGAPGMAYIYAAYRSHAMINATVDADSYPATVLVRALAPVYGLAAMRERRGGGVADSALTNGPGKLSAALGITPAHNGIALDLQSGHPPLLFFANVTAAVRAALTETGTDSAAIERVRDLAYIPPPIVAATRIGLSQGQDLLWRYYYKGDPYVSRRDKEAEARLSLALADL